MNVYCCCFLKFCLYLTAWLSLAKDKSLFLSSFYLKIITLKCLRWALHSICISGKLESMTFLVENWGFILFMAKFQINIIVSFFYLILGCHWNNWRISLSERWTWRTAEDRMCDSSKIEKLLKSVAESTMACTSCRKTKDTVEKEGNRHGLVLVAVRNSKQLANSLPKEIAEVASSFTCLPLTF